MDAVPAALLAWYAAGHRDLPWRRTTDPYAILVSEVMLQQTQVARVVLRWETWVRRWPTARDLADARREEVLAAWVGLGYNARAVRLQEACRVVAASGWPRDAAGLRALPGVGPYTAAAVASFAFGEQVAAVDVNVARVAARLGRRTPEDLLPEGRAADFNQAMMELGATVCRARAADCAACPLAGLCASAGRVEIAPRAAPGAGRPPFETTNRWVRGRVVAALAAGEGLPGDIEPERLATAVDGLVREGLLKRVDGGLSLG